MRVSYPQYLRLKNLQERVIKMDQTLAKIASVVPKEKLKSHPKWNKLVKLHASLRKVLPSEYLRYEAVKLIHTGFLSHLSDLLPKSSSQPRPARLPIHAT